MTESDLHAAVMDFLLGPRDSDGNRVWRAGALPDGAVIHHSPNEGKRGWRSQEAMKRHGVQAGWPDLEIVWQGRIHFIELKAPKRRLSPAQKALHPRLRDAGAVVVTCRSLEEVETILGLWGLPLRARLKGRAA